MINGHPQNVGEMFDHAGYFPVTCTNHDQPHAVNRDDAIGEMRCTAGCHVQAVVAATATPAALRARRMKQGLSQARLAELAGVSKRSIANLELESVKTSRPILAAIITALGGNPDLELGPEPRLPASYDEIDGEAVYRFTLPSGHQAIVSAEDRHLVDLYRWRTHVQGSTTYVYGKELDGWRVGRKRIQPRKEIKLHRLIAKAPAGLDVDHINHNGLDNRRSNLRLATSSQNGANQRRGSRNTSGLKGVSWDEAKNKWATRVGKRYVGRFDTAAEAAEAYNRAAVQRWGEFAHTIDVPVVRDPEDRIGQALSYSHSHDSAAFGCPGPHTCQSGCVGRCVR